MAKLEEIKEDLFKKNKKADTIKDRLNKRKQLIKEYDLPTSKPGCLSCNELSIKICGSLFGKFSEKRLSVLPEDVIQEITGLKKVFLSEVSNIECVTYLHNEQNLANSKKYIVCDRHWKEGQFIYLLNKKTLDNRFTAEQLKFRETIKMKCQYCLKLREQLDVNKKRADCKVHENQVMRSTLKLDALISTIQEREAVCAQLRKAKNIEEHASNLGKKEKKKKVLVDRDLKDNVAMMGYDEKELKEIDWVYYHRGRSTTKDPDSTHSSARDTVINSIKAQIDGSSQSFELKPKILGDNKNKKDSNEKIFCMKCPCPNKDATKCDRWICIETMFRRLSTLPPTISNSKDIKDIKIKMQRDKKRKEYLRELNQLKVRIDNVEFKLRRVIRLEEAQKKDPTTVVCLYCDIGLASAFKGDEKDLLALEDFYKEQSHIRKCDTCNTVFCKNSFNMGAGEQACGHKYFIGEAYVNHEEKNDDPREDHRKMTCIEVHTINADPSLKLIGKTSRVCPHCKMAVQLRDGCNSIKCSCGKYFCWLCGEGVHKDPLTGKVTVMTTSIICHNHSAYCSGAKNNHFHNVKAI